VISLWLIVDLMVADGDFIVIDGGSVAVAADFFCPVNVGVLRCFLLNY